jgi:hypothetical protein
MSKIIIGTAHGKNIGFDIAQLLVSRLLVQANSGGGKSFLLRRLLEQGFGKVQEIVIDPMGEFATLREKFGFVLVGEHGETPADVRSAGLVAEKLLELRASAVCDLYSLKPLMRHTWVRLFLEAVMNAPKRLWHSVLVVVDEAHKFCPEKGEGESEAKEPMLSLASDGRKYGFCAVFATQRLAKLDKSAASELTNVLIGPTFMDIDLQRAHKALGIVQRDQAAFNEQMKTIAPGHFWALGRAISKTRLLVKIGAIQTTHPTAGSGKYSAEPPPAPEKVKLLLPKLADLPKEAEEKARTEAEFKREIRDLKTQLKAAERAQPSAAAPAPATKADPQQARTIRELRALLEDAMKITAKINAIGFEGADVKPEEISAAIEKAAAEVGKIAGQKIQMKRRELESLKAEVNRLISKLQARLSDDKIKIAVDLVKNEPVTIQPSRPFPPAPSRPFPPAPRVHEPRAVAAGNGEIRLGRTHREIAGYLAGIYPEAAKVTVLAAHCGKVPGGSFSARLSEVRAAGLLEDPRPGWVKATEKCSREYAGAFVPPSTTEEVLALWAGKRGQVHLDILNVLVELRGSPISMVELAERVGKIPGGSFSARVSEVRSTGLLIDAGRGLVAANKEALFLDAA